MYLNVHSYYSLRYGTLSLEELVALASKHGIQGMALTDINNSAGVMDFVRQCRKQNLHAVAGMEFRKENTLLYTVLAQNMQGFYEINELQTRHTLEKTELPLSPGMDNTFIIYPVGSKTPNQLHENEYIGIRPGELNRLATSSLKRYTNRLVAFSPVTFTNGPGYQLHLHLRAIDQNTLLSKIGPEQSAPKTELLLAPDELRIAYEQFPQLLHNAERLLGNCSFDMDFSVSKNKQTFTDSKADDIVLLRRLAYEGLEYRYGCHHAEARRRIEHELELIIRLGFASYFLITRDMVHFSMSRGIYHVGRGSGANSTVAYCLRITDVDPIELDLYFERFINPKRTSPPDFDIDYSWKDRDMVHDYLFRKYGPRHCCLLGATVTFQGKSILRELSKVYGLPKSETDSFIENPTNPALQSDITRSMLKYGRMMQDFPNIRSIHAGGVLISEFPITYYTALDLPPKGYPTTQWDMYTAEDIGFEKLDVLSQRGIGHIQECAEIILRNRDETVDVHNVPMFKTDEKSRLQIFNGETIGCFYIESPAMRGLLKKLRCQDYITLVAASSIIRPGVAQSGMMREYILRFHNPGRFSYIHPVMEQQLKETYGVMVYQEDVLKICHHFAGLDLADADILRRVMSGKPRFRNEFEKIVERFFSNCRERGYPEETTKEVWRQIESFAGYSFSKAHSASYAAESFQSLYLKAHYPVEFMVAVINNFGGFYRTWVYFNEARRCGGNIQLPCVNQGEMKTHLKGNDIYIGFIHLAGLESKVAESLVEEREQRGPYCGLEDFIARTGITREQAVILVRSGALRFTSMGKAELLWKAHLYMHREPVVSKTSVLFSTPSRQFTLPEMPGSPIEDAYDEIELLGFPVTLSWFDLLQTPFRGEVIARNMIQGVKRKVRMVGTLVTIKYVWTKKKDIMHFATFLDKEGNFFDTVHFPKALKEYPFIGHGVYLLLGILTEEFGYPSLTVEKMAKLPLKPDPRFGKK